ncbi:MAG: hypothetical protein H6577_24750 [Lewinellaceae bacterium]|nr:hypothetical protein [Saprospiraceae bacterium]MCB9341346.1 hypothetical protein [Lewinellaceae bacterium]
MFFYNKDGYLRPYTAIESDLEAFRQAFTWNEHRQLLFDKYLAFNEELNALQPGPYYQWVDGSFVSKKELPGDVDFVTFVDFGRYKMLKSRLGHLGEIYNKWLDVSFAVNYPESHPLHNVTLILKDEYHHLYGSTRQHPVSKLSRPKGYLLIKF